MRQNSLAKCNRNLGGRSEQTQFRQRQRADAHDDSLATKALTNRVRAFACVEKATNCRQTTCDDDDDDDDDDNNANDRHGGQTPSGKRAATASASTAGERRAEQRRQKRNRPTLTMAAVTAAMATQREAALEHERAQLRAMQS